MRDLTNRQRELLRAIEKYVKEHGYPPSHRELADTLGMRSTSSVAMRLDALERRGLIKRDHGVMRSLRVVSDACKP